jgi:preprotein translocase subunit SecA
MIKKLFSKLFDYNQKTLNEYQRIVHKINDLEPRYKKFKDDQFEAETARLKLLVERGTALDEILPEAFALVREAAHRKLDQRMFDVQLMASIALHQGKVAEQKTGEGKTLSAVPALYLNSLAGKGVHLVTVNDYLARIGAGWMGPVLELLGVSVGIIYSGKGEQPAMIYDSEFTDSSQSDPRLKHLRNDSRRQAYNADITYGTNNEFGFDYLRDNMVQNLKEMVQRSHHYAIVDEVDSVLIDEARTPLIISAPDTEPTEKYYQFFQLINKLSADTDYVIDEKLKTANLTDHGVRKVEKILGVDNLYEKDFDTIHHIENALRARTLYLRDRDYLVKDGQVIIVDEFTGRLMYGRRWSEGLHQAVEAKEGMKIQQESRTLATVSFQNYFRLYKKLAGMTGTAATEAEEFRKIYNLDVLVLPTNRQVVRQDHPDVVYKTVRAKYAALVKEIQEKHEHGQPILVGTTSVEKNETVHEFLRRKNIPHNVLNAKQHEREALTIAEAGKPGAVTVATNMAGRGVDIVLGGALPDDREDKKAMEEWQKSHDQVLKAGGLHVIGTERHESRRIDNQLRGRSGRQGDPGSSRFYVSLDDDIMRIFGGEQIQKLMTVFKMPEDIPLEHAMVSRAIQQAQQKVEGFHFDSRKHVVEYDDVMNKQREIIYQRRRKILESIDQKDKVGTELKDQILGNLQTEMDHLVTMYSSGGYNQTEYDKIIKDFAQIVPFDLESQERIKKQLSQLEQTDKIVGFLKDLTQRTYDGREKQLGPEVMRQVERFVILTTIDKLWMDHLDAMDDLREGIGLRGYGQLDPLVEYKKEAFVMFEQLVNSIDFEIVRKIFRVQVGVQPQPLVVPSQMVEERREFSPLPTATDSPSTTASSPAPRQTVVRPVVSGKTKVGRNDPCPCGAINPNTSQPYKYKKCGMINAPYHKG